MDDGPQEDLEHAEHARHAAHAGDPFLIRVSVTIALLAVGAASIASLESLETAATLSDKNDAALMQNKATDQWSFFQAKSIKKNMYEIAGVIDGAHADGFRAAAKRNDDESRAIQTEATNLAGQVEVKLRSSDVHERRHQTLTIAVTMLHVAIAIGTVSLLIRRTRWPWYAAIGLGAIGLAATVVAYV
ncbi:MAG: DUF4337 family protein [Devosia sp.]|nr:DUF4337 family protein [Devosia sp.]